MPTSVLPRPTSSRDLGDRTLAGVDQVAGAAARQVPGQQPPSGRQVRSPSAGSTSSPACRRRPGPLAVGRPQAGQDGRVDGQAGRPVQPGQGREPPAPGCPHPTGSAGVTRRSAPGASGAATPASAGSPASLPARRRADAMAGIAGGRLPRGSAVRPRATGGARRPPVDASAATVRRVGAVGPRARSSTAGVEHGGRAPRCAAPPRRCPGRPWDRAARGLVGPRSGAGRAGRHHACRRGPRQPAQLLVGHALVQRRDPGDLVPDLLAGSENPRSTPSRAASSLAITQSGQAPPRRGDQLARAR